MSVVTYLVISLTHCQILAVTCDNASANDTMVTELEDKTPHFGGQSTRARCFLHVTNLVAKTMVKTFDVLHKSIDKDGSAAEDEEMQQLADSIESENW